MIYQHLIRKLLPDQHLTALSSWSISYQTMWFLDQYLTTPSVWSMSYQSLTSWSASYYTKCLINILPDYVTAWSTDVITIMMWRFVNFFESCLLLIFPYIPQFDATLIQADIFTHEISLISPNIWRLNWAKVQFVIPDWENPRQAICKTTEFWIPHIAVTRH